MGQIKINTSTNGAVETIYENDVLIYGTVAPTPTPTFNLDSFMNLCNLQSTNANKFTIVGGKVSEWIEENGITKWVQPTDGRRPTLVNGVPTFSGANTSLLRSENLSLTNYSLYCVVRNVGKNESKAVFSTLSTADERFSFANKCNEMVLKTVGGSICLSLASATGNRDNVISIRVNGNVARIYINDRLCGIKSYSFSGQVTNIGVLMGLFANSSWSMNGTLKAFCVSSAIVTDEEHRNIIDGLYTRYNLASNISTDCILAIGDSNLAGSGSAISFTNPLGIQCGLSIANLGVSGALLTPLAGTVTNSIFNRQEMLFTKPFKDWVIIAGGTNDTIYNVSADDFYNYYNQILSNASLKGYDMSKVILVSPPYQKDNAREVVLNEYNAKIVQLATQYGCKHLNLLQIVRDNGGNSLLLDSVHLNQTGQNLWQTSLYNLINS